MNKKFARLFFACTVLFAAGFLLPSAVLADAPRSIELKYDMQAQKLMVKITHPSTFTSFHYIQHVLITRNNEPVENWDYTSQPAKTSFTYTYKIRAAENDLLEATATCNVQGRKSVVLTVGRENE
jgi:desulfoferrodoxin (superoxide reductase-like protein)